MPVLISQGFRLYDFEAGIDCVPTVHVSASTGRVCVQVQCPLWSSHECPSSVLVWQLVYFDVLFPLHQHFDVHEIDWINDCRTMVSECGNFLCQLSHRSSLSHLSLVFLFPQFVHKRGCRSHHERASVLQRIQYPFLPSSA